MLMAGHILEMKTLGTCTLELGITVIMSQLMGFSHMRTDNRAVLWMQSYVSQEPRPKQTRLRNE